jgi:hypothetical protein
MVIDEIADFLEDNITGYTKGENIYKAFQPDTPNNCLVIRDTGGPPPDKYIPTADPTFQILVRNISYPAAQDIVDQIVTLLHQKAGVTLGDHYYYSIFLLGEPGYIGKDEKNRYEFSANFIAHIRR